MRKSLMVVAFFAAIGAGAQIRAQETPLRFELYGGYDYVRVNVSASDIIQPPSQSFNGNGGSGQFVYNITDRIGILGDLSGFWATNAYNQGAALPYLFGPRLNFRRGRLAPFAQLLVGGVATSSGIGTSGWQNNFAMTAGGGIDIRVSEHFSIRPMQAEYFLTKIPDGLNNRQDNFRFGAGVSLLFGKR
jgi:opacity protein-like surface antigen